MSTGIYVIQGEGDLLEMEEQAYESEDRLQALLAQHPSIIPGGQIDGANPRRWLLICREAGIPGSEDSGGRWSLDHLLVDQDAIPTLVEVKRSQDTRIRREVVGQMLEYAANVSTYWTLDLLRAQFSATCHERGREAEQVLGEFLDESADAENFWQTVADNLRAGRLRLVFVADVIPTELQAIVEFLNSQMQQVEVIAVEVKRYGAAGTSMLVSRVLGQTAAKKARTEGRQWDEASFFADLERRNGPDEVRVARRILEWADRRMSHIWWGKGQKDGSMIPVLDVDGTSHWFVVVWTYARAEMQFQHMATRPPFDDLGLRQELLARLNEIPGVSIPEAKLDKRPSIPLAVLVNEEHLRQFLSALDWCIEQVRGTREQ